MSFWPARERWIRDILPQLNVELSESAMVKISKAVKFCCEKTAHYDESHDVMHHLDTVENMVVLINIRGITDEEEIVRRIITMMIHDILDYKYCSPRLAGAPTIEEQADMITEFLRRVVPKHTDRILNNIQNMSWSKVQSGKAGAHDQELRDCRDADWIEALRNAIQRLRAYRTTCMPDAPEEEIISEMVKHCEEKLFKVPDGCYSEWAKCLVKAHLLRYVVPFYNKHSCKTYTF